MDNPVTNLTSVQRPVVVTGAAGRVGQALRAVWGHRVAGRPILWSARTPAQSIDLPWNISQDPAPLLGAGAVFLHLAGKTSGTEAALAENRQSAEAVARAAARCKAAHVFLVSTAAVYRPSPDPIDETVLPDPVSPYGRAKRAAELAMQGPFGLTVLRLGNLAGADVLLERARQGRVTLDPIAGQPGGPERSYIGPRVLAAALEGLILRVDAGQTLPPVVNLAQHPPVAMADLLQAAGADWGFGAPRAEAVPRVALDVSLLSALVPLPPASAEGLMADLSSLDGVWP